MRHPRYSEKCMLCARDAVDATDYDDMPEALWVYCADCDCWTEHPREWTDDGQLELWPDLWPATPRP